MEGSLAGNGAAWPLPSVINAALHAALHRSGLDGHPHDHAQGGRRDRKDARTFGSLVSEGPFPVRTNRGDMETWFFPRPMDLCDDTLAPNLLPVKIANSSKSNLPEPLVFPVGNQLAPTKDVKAKAWISLKAYEAYLQGEVRSVESMEACDDADCFDMEAQVGIGIDPRTGTTGQGDAAGKIYSARYLRLRDGWNLGVFAKTDEKSDHLDGREDLISGMIGENGRILVGGQQRVCTASVRSGSHLPLPRGRTGDFEDHEGRHLVKWALLSPAIYPAIPDRSKDGRPMTPHTGGWLPNWVRQTDGQVMLRSGKRKRRSYGDKHHRGFEADAGEIHAKLVSAIVPKPVVVTGWGLANGVDRVEGGAKSSHLAVPAGAVYYFEAESEEHARKLAAALNWHGDDPEANAIMNRRSTLMGEKGFGLGVCGTWKFFGT